MRSNGIPVDWENSRSAAPFSLHPFATFEIPILSANRSTKGLSSPEIRPSFNPARRARDKPITSSNEKRFDSSPDALHKNVPSVSTPSTSITSASIDANRSTSDTSQLFHDWDLTIEHTLLAVPERRLDKADIPHQTSYSIWLQRCGLIATPHRTIHR